MSTPEQRAKNAAYMREWNRRKRESDPEWVARDRARNARGKAKRTAEIDEIKLAAGCVDCGYRAHAVALDFDHRPGEVKLFSVAWGKAHAWANVLAEMAKCDVVCANCHRIRTLARLQADTEPPAEGG
jgi:hypothetical protein